MIVAFLPKLAEAIRALIPVFFVSFLGGRHSDRTEIFVALIGVLGGFGAIGAYVTTRFDVVDGQIIHRSGWIFRRDRRIPLSQVQNVNLRQGVLERLLKVVTLEIETAAGKGAELKLSVLPEREAERLRNELMAESSHPEEVERDEDVYRISNHDLWLGAVTEHHFIAFIFAALPVVGMGQILALTHFWEKLPPIPRVLFAGFLGVLGLVAGWLFGAVQYALRYGGFTVRREPGATRVSYGLLTKIQVVIRPARIEYAVLTSTPWQRLVGRQGLAVGTAGTFGEQGAMAKLALMMPNESVKDAVAAILPGLDVTRLPWRPFPRLYFRIVLVRGVISTLISAAIAYPFLHLPGTMRWFMLMLPFYVFADFTDRLAGIRRAGIAVDDEFIAVRQGFFRQRVEIMPLARAEVMMSSQPPWWRRRRLLSLHLKAMVHNLGIPVMTVDEAEALRNRLEDQARRRHAARVPKPMRSE